MTRGNNSDSGGFPAWLPAAARQYLRHVVHGESIRQIARSEAASPSTVARRVRQVEVKRDDPLVDEGLAAFVSPGPRDTDRSIKETSMNASVRQPIVTDERIINREARRILRRLCETGALLVLATDMEKAVVLRPGPSGEQTRTAVVDRAVAIAFALKDWIKPQEISRLSKYAITATGKAALKRLIEEERQQRRTADGRAPAFAEAQSPFQAQHRDWGDRDIEGEDGSVNRTRVNLAETPLTALARRKGADGKPFLTPDLVQVGEKLREDFERAQMGPRVGQNWERFLTGADRGGFLSGNGMAEGPRAARQRVSDALDDLGPGLGDVVMRVCCFLEGLESAEKRLGWSARSGKIVLKIGLQRLAKHYEDRYGFKPATRG
ncbi:helix-turn-helix domain-containing protein [Rhodobacterales bacterium HKCCE2091]|nr:helix-turn-helix domain-containing protein [Rhodobacterales bacterium HKCCE2091]